jgi:hypothetical protein
MVLIASHDLELAETCLRGLSVPNSLTFTKLGSAQVIAVVPPLSQRYPISLLFLISVAHRF